MGLSSQMYLLMFHITFGFSRTQLEVPWFKVVLRESTVHAKSCQAPGLLTKQLAALLGLVHLKSLLHVESLF